MSKKKFDNVVLTPQTNKFGVEVFVNEINLLFSKDYVNKSKEVFEKHALAIYFAIAVTSVVLMLVVNLLFVVLLVVGLVKMFDSYKFYLIKKDFDENGIF